MRTILWGLHEPLVRDSMARLESEGFIDIKLWFIDPELRTTDFFSARDNVQDCHLDVPLNIWGDDLMIPPRWVSDAMLAKYPSFLQHFARETKFSGLHLYEYTNLFQTWVRYFYTLLIKYKIELILFSDIPHPFGPIILYNLAKILKLKTLILVGSSSFLGAFDALFRIEDYSDMRKSYLPKMRTLSEPIKIPNTYKKELYYMSPKHLPSTKNTIQKKTRALRSPRSWLLERIGIFTKTFSKYANIGDFLSIKTLRLARDYRANTSYRQGTINQTEKKIDFTAKYVYFPLHLQPEMTTDTIGNEFADQLLALERLSLLLPPDYLIYVKENPKQTALTREKYFFARLKLIPNTILVDRSVDTYELIEHSAFVATITGTVGWEAITGGKNVLIFGDTWYAGFPGVFRYNELTSAEDYTLYPKSNIEPILTYKINHAELEECVQIYLTKTGLGVWRDDIQEGMPELDLAENSQNLYNSFQKLLVHIRDKYNYDYRS